MKLFQVTIMILIDRSVGTRKDYKKIIVEARDAREALEKVDKRRHDLESIGVRELIETELYKER